MLLYWKVKFFKRPCWNSEITVKTWARKFLKVSSFRDFEVYDKEEKLIAIGTTEWVLIDTKKGSVGKITDKMAEEYDGNPKSVFEEEIVSKLKPTDNMEKICEYTAKRRDIDVNHHVNNVNYLEIAYEAFPEGTNIKFDNLEIYYKKQIKLGETVSLFYSKENEVHTVCIKSKDEKTIHAVLKFF